MMVHLFVFLLSSHTPHESARVGVVVVAYHPIQCVSSHQYGHGLAEMGAVMRGIGSGGGNGTVTVSVMVMTPQVQPDVVDVYVDVNDVVVLVVWMVDEVRGIHAE